MVPGMPRGSDPGALRLVGTALVASREWGPLQDPAHWGDCLTTMAFRLKVSSVGSSRMNLLNSFDALLARNGKRQVVATTNVFN